MRGATAEILVVTDEPRLGGAIVGALQRAGRSAVLAATASEAVRRLAADAPAAIVVDLAFAEMDPEQIVHRALVCRETHGSPVIVLAARDGEHDRDALLEGGCAAVLERESEPAALARALLVHLSRA